MYEFLKLYILLISNCISQGSSYKENEQDKYVFVCVCVYYAIMEASPRICQVNQWAQDPEKPTDEFQSKGQQTLDPRRADVSGQIGRQEKADAAAQRIWCHRQEESFLTFEGVSIFIDLMRSTHIRESDLLYSVYLIKCSSHSETPT